MAGLGYRAIVFRPIHQSLSRLDVHRKAAGDSARDSESSGDYIALPECFLQSEEPACSLSSYIYNDVESEKYREQKVMVAEMSCLWEQCRCRAQEPAGSQPPMILKGISCWPESTDDSHLDDQSQWTSMYRRGWSKPAFLTLHSWVGMIANVPLWRT